MKLSAILENITRHDFYDFYALMYAYQADPTPEVESHLKHIVNYVLNDHLNQLARIIINRVCDDQHPETMAILGSAGIRTDEFHATGLDELTFPEKASIIRQVVKFEHEHGFTGQTWLGLARTVASMDPIPQDLKGKIMLIDKIYNLLHHGGQITDYMDEKDWIEDALNYRDSATPSQIFAKASPQTRATIGRATYTNQPQSPPVTEIAKLYTSLRRAAKKYCPDAQIQYSQNQLSLQITAADIYIHGPQFGPDGFKLPSPTLTGKLPKHYEKAAKQGKITISKPYTGHVQVTETDTDITITGPSNQLKVPKPINRQYHLATDLIFATANTGKGWPLEQNYSIGSIKKTYYHNRNK